MQTLYMHIRAQSKSIPTFIGRNSWSQIRDYILHFFSNHSVFVISDSNVAELLADKIRVEFSPIPAFREMLIFPAGEQNKNRREKEKLEDQLMRNKGGRDTLLIALGGGVTGDLAGFVAATYYRGIPLIHVPTSLLAQVDSSIGGKVGINHPVGKNLLGAFHQPEAIFVDLDLLRTLSRGEFLNGMAEVIKYAVLFDSELWKLLQEESGKILNHDGKIVKEIVSRCIQLKINVVEKDEKESGYRSILNFGHTVGHALEKLSDYRIRHGEAIAAGMRIAALLSVQLVQLPRELLARLKSILALYDLDSALHSDFTSEQIWATMLADKKARQQAPRFTLLRNINQPELFYPVRKEDFTYALSEA